MLIVFSALFKHRVDDSSSLNFLLYDTGDHCLLRFLLLNYVHTPAKHLRFTYQCVFALSLLLTFASLGSLVTLPSCLSIHYFETGFADVAVLLFFFAGESNLNSEATIGE